MFIQSSLCVIFQTRQLPEIDVIEDNRAFHTALDELDAAEEAETAAEERDTVLAARQPRDAHVTGRRADCAFAKRLASSASAPLLSPFLCLYLASSSAAFGVCARRGHSVAPGSSPMKFLMGWRGHNS
ncbi:hypothetical protein N7494_005340 [Penicillium frequentans]|uniref:Uncharacterized protein n=1 Tax=Penicillium frequentans TaxID=3151616 RepID=A0AAD6D0E7_9EURO|nr:hypothetical protein N7494_005340 [Penicillium glabrum]